MRFVILIVAGALVGCTGGASVAALKTQYPIVHYHGPKAPATVTLEKSRPANWVGIHDVSKVAVGAIIVSEDWAFYQHQGFDPKQMQEAFKENLEEHRYVRGASTITQQVARNVFLDKGKTMLRKIKELYIAIRMEKSVGKTKILESYLNIAEWGEGVFGIRQAAETYFHKNPRDLTAKEGAFLAMLLPSPKRYSQSFRAKHLTDYAESTVDDILDKMVQADYISSEERATEGASKLSFEL